MPQVLFIGAGEIGTALAHVINDRANIDLWDKDPAQAPNMKPLEESVPLADVIFLCVPSWVMSKVVAKFTHLLRPSTVIVSLAKGIELETFKTMDAILAEALPPNQPCGVLGGPLLAEELTNKLPGIGVFASTSASAYTEVAKLFSGSNVRLEYAADPHTVALAAVLKNVYAVGLGVAEGLGWGWNGKGWLAAQALQEMTGIVEALGGNGAIIASSAGAGDFLATAMSPDSRNRTTGQEIAQTGACQTPSEGCRSVASVITMLHGNAKQFPVLIALDNIINQHAKPGTVFQDLLATPEVK
jgi:glycerol-3-phosphate dehydrogenase (NAD(P)+)